MNDFSTKIYNDLISLTESSKKKLFFFKDHEKDGVTYRVFSYHMGSYTEFCRPSALECRGAMFRMNGDSPAELVSLPYPKFFNVHEVNTESTVLAEALVRNGNLSEKVFKGEETTGSLTYDDLYDVNDKASLFTEFPFSRPVDYSDIKYIEEKADGSLITTYNHNGTMRLKSKTSLTSIMADLANEYVFDVMNFDLAQAMHHYHHAGFTIVGEWCDSSRPETRIVLAYDKPQLRIFGIRRNEDGVIVDYRTEAGLVGDGDDTHKAKMQQILIEHSVKRYYLDDVDMKEFDAHAVDEKGIEGYIYVFNDELRQKRKTEWYITQHRLKDTVKNVDALFMAVVAESSDDLKSIFHDNQDAVNLILAMEEFAQPVVLDLIESIEAFHSDNKELDRKDYAIKGQAELPRYAFSAAMNLYLGKEYDHKLILEKNVKTFTKDFNYSLMESTDE